LKISIEETKRQMKLNVNWSGSHEMPSSMTTNNKVKKSKIIFGHHGFLPLANLSTSPPMHGVSHPNKACVPNEQFQEQIEAILSIK
jgi:hypothetical protein